MSRVDDYTGSPFWLGEDVYCCDVGEGAVLLDLRRDRYFSVPKTASEVLESLVADWPQTRRCGKQATPDGTGRAVAHVLRDRGLLSELRPSRLPRTNWVAGTETAFHMIDLSEPWRRPPWDVWLRFMRAFAAVVSCQRLRSLRANIEHLRQTSARLTARGRESYEESQVLQSVAYFERLRPLFYTARMRCFLDSLVLAEFLIRSGIDPTFFVGVRMRPFGAHSWVQWHGIVLNDTVEHSGSYEPILVV